MRDRILALVALAACGALMQEARAIGSLDEAIRILPRLTKERPPFPLRQAAPPASGIRIIGAPDNNSFDEGPSPDAIPETVDVEAFPWAVAIVQDANKTKESYLCGGVIIEYQWVLTAAHCTKELSRRWPNESSPVVVVGTAALDLPGRQFAIDEIIPHPKFDAATSVNDVALLRIDIKEENAGRPIRLEGPPIAQQAGEVAQIVGWGASNRINLEKGNKDRLQLIQAMIQDPGVCFTSPNYPARRKTDAFCAQSALKHHDTCARFAGGPVVLHDKAGIRYLAGLVSAGEVCPPDDRKPNVYIDIQQHTAWIRSIINRRMEAMK